MIEITGKHFNKIHRYRRVWPKYSTQKLNIAAANCKAFDKEIVGSAKDLWLEMRSLKIRGTFENWCSFYKSKPYIQNIPQQTDKLFAMIQKMEIGGVTRDMCEDYIWEVLENKTHMGMAREEMAIEAVANYYKLPYRFSTAEEETQGIDGWIGDDIPVQVKPEDSVFKAHVHNHPDRNKVLLVTYESKNFKCYIHNPDFYQQKAKQ
jgi:hypothetical protein